MNSDQLAEIYRDRRRRLAKNLGEGIALINSAGVAPDPLLYDMNLKYLTGLSSKEATLVLAPDGIRVAHWETIRGPEVGRGREVTEALFVEQRSEWARLLDGEGDSYDKLRRATGVEEIMELSELNEMLHRELAWQKVLWLNTPAKPRLDAPLSAELARIDEMRRRYYWLDFRNAANTIHRMRRIKDDYEIDCLRRAFEAHARIYEKIMRALKPGENESLGQAIFEYEAHKLPPEFSIGLDLYDSSIIVAAGKNAAVGHYMDNNQQIQDGDLVLMDSGVLCNGYSSDITTTFPANGRFSPRQRELYAVVLEAQKKAIATMKPGSSNLEAHKAAYEHFKEHGLAQYTYGRAGHPVGLNIHDPNGEPDLPYEPGVVQVIEPWLSMPEEGIGIRIESGVLITEDGCELLPEPPKEIDEIEELCRRD